MKYISYEFKKLFGIRYLWIFLALLIAVNGGIAFYTARHAHPEGISSQEISDFYELYFNDTARMEEYYAKLQARQEEQSALITEAIRSGNYDFESESWVNKFAPDGYSDQALFRQVYDSINAAKNYSTDMQKVINRAKANLAEYRAMGISEESYTYKYQVRVIQIYEQLRDNVKIGVEYTHGWGEYFGYEMVNIFIFIILIMFGSVIFAQEKVSGFLPIVRTTRYGRWRTAFAKISVMGLFTIGVVLAFTLTTWAVFGLELGYSSASNAIQAFSNFTYCEYIITVGQYFVITILLKILTFLAFVMLLLALSVFVYNYAIIYATGLGFFGVNFLLYNLSYLNADNPFKNLNFVSTAAVNPLFIRFRSVNFFSNVWGYVSCMLTLFSILITAGIIISALVFAKRGDSVTGFAFRNKSGSLSKVMFRKQPSEVNIPPAPRSLTENNNCRMRTFTGSLVTYEIYKTLISSRLLLIVLALMCIKIFFFADSYRSNNSYADVVYKDYMTTLEGELTEEKSRYISDERAFITNTKAMYEEMRLAYINGDISHEKYREYLADYNYAQSHDEALKKVEDHQAYLKQVEKKTGVRGWFLYDTGWRKLINTGADLYLFATILLLCAGTFADEYISRSSFGPFVRVLRSTKKGRINTFRAKLSAAVIMTLIVSLFYNAAEYLIIFKNYDMPSASAPLLSIEQFGNISTGPFSGMSVIQYLFMMSLVRVVAALLLAVFITGLSELIRRVVPILSVTVAVALLPALLNYFGLTTADKVNYLNFFGGTQIFIKSVESKLLGTDFGGLIIFIAACIFITDVVLLRAYLTYTK